MPIYEYRCAACGHHLEALQKMSESPLRKCPECGKSQLRRLVSASRFRLKGSGWYETDFKNQGETKRNLVEKGGESGDSAAKSEASTGTTASTDTAASKDGAAAAPAVPAADKAASPKSEAGKSKSAAKRTTTTSKKPKPKSKPAKPARR